MLFGQRSFTVSAPHSSTTFANNTIAIANSFESNVVTPEDAFYDYFGFLDEHFSPPGQFLTTPSPARVTSGSLGAAMGSPFLTPQPHPNTRHQAAERYRGAPIPPGDPCERL